MLSTLISKKIWNFLLIWLKFAEKENISFVRQIIILSRYATVKSWYRECGLYLIRPISGVFDTLSGDFHIVMSDGPPCLIPSSTDELRFCNSFQFSKFIPKTWASSDLPMKSTKLRCRFIFACILQLSRRVSNRMLFNITSYI